jgi:hypothetical protein
MGRNEIKLRQNNMSEGHIARHRNYGLLMKRHRRDLRMRRLTIALIYLLIIIAVTVLFIIVKKEEQQRNMPSTPRPVTALLIDPIRSEPMRVKFRRCGETLPKVETQYTTSVGSSMHPIAG